MPPSPEQPPRPAADSTAPRPEGAHPDRPSSTVGEAPATAAPAAPLPTRAGRFRLADEIARGGMGAVVRAVDDDLGRTLAVKVLLDRHQTDAAMVQRFLEEARVCGQLQHPGVPPIYELGRLPDGRPFFAMKLVNGHTLADLLRRRATPAEDLPRFLQVFEQVCQTVAAAHSKGVIHRDLKPSNVMVGAFGEVQVMDWGLAKPVAQPTTPAPTLARNSTLYTTRAGESDWLTQAGTVLGTPAYMPPEQARGQVDHLDERADVFGLGAILCEVLTGQPPYGDEARDTVKQAAEGDLTGARERLAACGADRELVDLVLACLQFQPAQRPRDAGAVAQLLAAYRTGVQQRLRQAELERTAAQVKVGEERKRRKWQLGLAAAVLGLLALAAGGGLWLERQQADRRAEHQRQAEQTRHAVLAGLDQAAELRRHGRWPDARAVLDQAAGLLGDQEADGLRQRLEQSRADLKLAADLDAIRLERANVLQYRFDKSGAARKYARVFQAAGLSPEDGEPAAVAERVRASAVHAELVAGLDDWALVTPDDALRARLLATARLADPDPWRDRLRDPAAWQDRAALERLAAAAPVAEQSPPVLALLGERLRTLGADAAPLLLAAQKRFPADFWLNVQLGIVLYDRSEYEESLGYLRAALTVRPDSPAVYRLLGGSLQGMRRLAEARAACEQALRLDAEPDAATHNLVGNILVDEGRLEEAAAAYRRALEIEPKYAYAQNNLGWLLEDRQGRLQEGLKAYRRALELDPRLSAAHNGMGQALLDLGRLDEAAAEFHKAIELDPTDAWPHSNLGRLLEAEGRLDEAVRSYQRALEINPRHARARANLGQVYIRQGRPEEGLGELYQAALLDPRDAWPQVCIGQFLRQRGRLDEAIAAFRKGCEVDPWNVDACSGLASACSVAHRPEEAIQFFEEAVRRDPNNPVSRTALGTAFYYQGKLDDSIREYREALRRLPDHSWPWNALGVSLSIKGEKEKALEALEKSLQIRPRQPAAHLNVGSLLEKMGQPDRAEAEFRAAITIDPRYALGYCRLGILRLQRGDRDGALKSLRKACELDAGNVPFQGFLCDALAQAGRWDETAAACRKALAVRPQEPMFHYYLGVALRHQGHLDEAVKALRRAVELNPTQAVTYGELGLALKAQGKGDEAVRALREGIRQDSKDPQAQVFLGSASLALGLLAEARAAFQRALELFPANSPALPAIRLQVTQCEALLALGKKLPDFEGGTAKPKDAKEAIALADLCQRYQKRYALACRFYAEALSEKPELGKDLRSNQRYNAACAAALAVAGKDKESHPADAKERGRLRQQALDWLRTDLEAWQARADRDRALVYRTMQYWEKDADLAGLRDPAALANLPDAERDGWVKLWAEVAKLKRRTAPGPAERPGRAAQSANRPRS